MHMADALLSPTVGAALWLASSGLLAHSARRVQGEDDTRRVPLMGVLGAFVFAAQMINFTIPGTGSSGHLGGGLLLAVLLGPHAALIVLASVLAVQALFFADGGLLALGANIFNLGVLPCLVAYPLVYRAIVGAGASPRRVFFGAVAAALVGLQLGALGVVLQTVGSGIAGLPLSTFLLMMLPIHLPIGLVEGLATAAILLFIQRAQPELVAAASAAPRGPGRAVLVSLGLVAVVTATGLSWLASSAPDGLEWSIEKSAGTADLPIAQAGLHSALAQAQHAVALLPDYRWPLHAAPAGEVPPPAAAAWPAVDAGTSLAGLVGGSVTLLLVGAIAALLRRRRR